MTNRIGLGQDSHPFSQNKNKPLILAGVIISDNNGLEANSDGDVILHSLCNAISSAIGGESLGTWADKMCKAGIKDSKEYLKHILTKIKEKNYEINNISISIEVKKPYFTIDQINLIKAKLANLLNIELNAVGITFTSGDGLTAFGKGEGMQAISIILLRSC